MISNDFIVTKARAAFSSCRVSSRASAKAYDKVWSTSKAVQSWCHSRNIVATYTSGSDWTSSGQIYNKNQHFKGTSNSHVSGKPNSCVCAEECNFRTALGKVAPETIVISP